MKSQTLLLLLLLCLLPSLSGLANGPWKEVASLRLYADQTTYLNLYLKNNKTEFAEVRLVAGSSGVRVQRTEIVTGSFMSLPAWGLDGDYRFGMERTDSFQKTKVRMIRLYVTTLQPREPVKIKVFMK